MTAKTITDSELEVMRILWKSHPLTLAQIRDSLTGSTKWSPSTIKTLVFRLRDKGVIGHDDKYGAARYEPLVSENDYVISQVPTFLERVFGGSAKKLVATLVDCGNLTEKDIADLREQFRPKDGNQDE